MPRKNYLVIWLLLGGLIARSAIAIWLLPGFDEAYYYLYSQHLDWSYFDHPLLVALTTGIGTWLTGIVSPFTIRLGTLILYTGSLGLLYLTSLKLFNLATAQLTLIIATIIPIFQIGFGVLTLPDSPLIFFWTASLYCAVGEFFGQSSLYFYRPSYRLAILGILVGLACLSKYHGFILALGLIIFCLISNRHRIALISPWTYLGLLLFILTLFPIWFWNLQHDWVSFRFQLSSRFQPELGVVKSGYSLLGVLGVLLGEIGYLFPTMGIPLWLITWQELTFQIQGRFINKSSITESILADKKLLILSVSLPLTIGFTLLGGQEQILAGWPMPGFWGLTILLGYYTLNWQKISQKWVKRWLLSSGIIVTTLLLIILLHINMGIFQKPSQNPWFGGFLAPQNDPSTELIDLQQLRQGFMEYPLLTKALNQSQFIFTNAYYLGGLIEMAIEPISSIPVTCFSDDTRGFAFWFNPEEWLGDNGLYITLERFQKMPEISAEFSYYFQSFQLIGDIPIYRSGVVTERYYIYQGYRLLKPYPMGLK